MRFRIDKGPESLGQPAPSVRVSPLRRCPNPGQRDQRQIPYTPSVRSPTASTPVETAPLASPTLSPDVDEQLSNDDGDHERFAHYVEKAKIVESAVTGAPVKALCGKVWIPNRDPSRFPICPDCERIHGSLPRGGSPGPGTPGDNS